MAYAPALTARPTGGRVPRVDVQLNTLAATTSYVNVYRTVDNRQMQVRGGLNVAAIAGVVIADEEAAFALNSYRAEMFTAGGTSLGFTDSASVTLSVVDVWIQNPFNPMQSVNIGPLGLRGNALDQLTRPFLSSTIYTENASVGRVVSARRQGLRGVVLDLVTTTLDQADILQAMFGTYDIPQLPVVCIRTPGPIRIPRTLFLHVPSGPIELSVDVQYGGSQIFWGLTGDEVAPPSPGLIVALLTYTDLDVSYASYTARDAAYVSYPAQDSDFSLAGAAGGL